MIGMTGCTGVIGQGLMKKSFVLFASTIHSNFGNFMAGDTLFGVYSSEQAVTGKTFFFQLLMAFDQFSGIQHAVWKAD